MRAYVHGAGRAGRDAWPHVPAEGAVFAELAQSLTAEQKIREVVGVVPPGATVIAHSAGAVPVVLGVADGSLDVTALVLVEPALYDVARGNPQIERHIATMTTARAHSDAGDLYAFWSIVRPLMFGGPVDAAAWESEQPTAAKFASIDLPWGHGVTADMVTGIPTLVITGGWNEEYEAIASALTAEGATHRQLVGNAHRPQDHPDFERTVYRFLTK